MLLCRNPYATSDGKAYGCGQCMPCRINRRRKWQARILLEATQWTDNTFLTLTYNDQNLPKTDDGLATLSPRDLRLFLDKVRFHFNTLPGRDERHKVRFFAVGEYGDETFRPHYHLALFNVPNCAFGMSVYSKLRQTCCPVCELLRKLWGKGHVYLGSLEKDSAGYVASYINKRMTKADDPRLGTRYPEFSRKSLKPGIGAMAMFDVADVMLRYGLENMVDVPTQLEEGWRKPIPLDRYLRRKLRTYVGKDEAAPQEVVDEIASEMSILFERAKAAKRSVREVFKAMILDENDADYAKFEARRKLFNRRRGIL